MGGGSSLIQQQSTPGATSCRPPQSGRLTIGAGPRAGRRARAAHRCRSASPCRRATCIRRGGRAAPAQPPPAPPRAPACAGRARPSPTCSGVEPAVPAPAGGRGRASCARSADKTKVYVGEQVVVEWLLYLTERAGQVPGRHRAAHRRLLDARTSRSPSNQGSLALTQQVHEGRLYLVAPLIRKALFPLQPGKLTITPLEAEISQVDFFGRDAAHPAAQGRAAGHRGDAAAHGGPARAASTPANVGRLRHRRPAGPQQGGGGRGGDLDW